MTVSLNQVLKNILSISQESILSHPLDQLLGKVCEACNDLFGYDLVWIGLVQEGQPIIPMAASGQEVYLEKVLSLAATASADGHDPSAIALRKHQSVTCNLRECAGECTHWSKFWSDWGFLSACSFPLQSENEPVGVLTVYSKDENAFNNNNIFSLELLANLAAMVITNARLNDEKAQLQASQKTLLEAIDASIDGIALVSLDGIYTYVNSAHAKIYGYEPENLLGKSWEDHYGPIELVYFQKHILPKLFHSGLWRGEAVGNRKDGTSFHQELSLTLITNHSGIPSGIICNVRDTSERKAMELELIKTKNELESLVDQLKTLAVTDDLTGLYNTRKFYEDLKKEMKRSIRTGRVFSLLVIDVDNFKQYNDEHGHLGGDKVLKKIGRLLKNALRKTDIAYRYGGDEFVVILPETAATQSKEVADKIRLIYEKCKLDPTTLSIGIAEYNPDYDQEQIIRLADVAMYEAKKYGNRVCITNQLPVHLM